MNPKPASMFAFPQPSCKTDGEVLTATSTSGNPNMSTGGGLLPVALQSGEQVFGFCNSLSALGEAIHVVGI
jgi:hypothetical protein